MELNALTIIRERWVLAKRDIAAEKLHSPTISNNFAMAQITMRPAILILVTLTLGLLPFSHQARREVQTGLDPCACGGPESADACCDGETNPADPTPCEEGDCPTPFGCGQSNAVASLPVESALRSIAEVTLPTPVAQRGERLRESLEAPERTASKVAKPPPRG